MTMNTPPVVSFEEWEPARERLLVKEDWEDSPKGYPQAPPYKWWNWHEAYAAGASPDPRWVKVFGNALDRQAEDSLR
jgi:predicted dithiol-disulfide oxidoreductase (DUF899 family)